jgi:uncharacterized protein YjiS (DUF1127 family)
MIMSITFTDFLRHLISIGDAASAPVRLAKLAQLIWQVRRERNQLSRLSREELADTGIHPVHARREAARGWFDLPKSRLEKL